MENVVRLDKNLKNPVHLDATIKAVEATEKSLKIRGFANTVSKDRAGDVIVASAWTTSNALKNYMKNPIILFGHDHERPIGKCVDIVPTEMGLEIEAEIFEDADPSIFSLIKNGVLKTFSVGFRILDADWDDSTHTFMILDLELFEVSVVSVPCNQDSTFNLAKSMNGLDYMDLRSKFAKQQDSEAKSKTPEESNLTEIEKLCMALGLTIEE